MSRSGDDEILQLFLVESREHLEDIETDLLEIERQGPNMDSELVNHVFRAIHTIKGASGFFGLHNIKDLSHVMEHLLDQIRKKLVVPNSQIISVLLDGADVLTQMINAPDTSNDTDIADLVASIANCVSQSLPGDNQVNLSQEIPIRRSDGNVLLTLTPLDLEEGIRDNKGGEHFYLVKYDLYYDVERKGKNALEVINELQELAFFIDSTLDIGAIGTLHDDLETFELPFYVLLASVMEHDLIAHFLDLEPNKVMELGEKELGLDPRTLLNQGAEPTSPSPAPVEKPRESPVAEWMPPAEPSPRPAEPAQAPRPSVEPLTQPEATAPAATDSGPQPPKRPKAERKSASSAKKVDANIRVNIHLLDRLMNLAGELVLTRNELILNTDSRNWELVDRTAQKVNIITSELQEAIMGTRMQSIGIIFTKFHRIVRELSRGLGKEINLKLEGEHVELDKTIIEAIGDPLTHLVRNACDHGIEPVEKRRSVGKALAGTLSLSAYHEAGMVVIEIADDGGGIPPDRIRAKALSLGLHTKAELESMPDKEVIRLIFAPGFSTASEVTELSGRGVGMDVVHTNLTRLGGTIDIDSTLGRGTTFRIKLPLTLAIIPSLLVQVEDQQFCVPQVNLQELVRIPQAEVRNRLEQVGGAPVIRLRGELLPLVRLRDVLGIEGTYRDPETGVVKKDRRHNIVDRRGPVENVIRPPDSNRSKEERDRRHHPDGALNIAVVSANNLRYGLIVDHLLDSAEIVVKPLGRHLKESQIYAGATILGTGNVACILDVDGICHHMKLREVAIRTKTTHQAAADDSVSDIQGFLLVSGNDEDIFGVPMELVLRIETANCGQVERAGGRLALKHRGKSLALFTLDDNLRIEPGAEDIIFKVIIFKIAGREVGLCVTDILDIIQTDTEIDMVTHKQSGIFGSTIINDRITLIVDLHGLVRAQVPEWIEDFERAYRNDQGQANRVLVVEDSEFFKEQVQSFVTEAGYEAITADDGRMALELLVQHAGDIRLVLTDIEMPHMNGYELTEAIRGDARLKHIPVVAITSMATTDAIEKGRMAGMDDYLIKLDREIILQRTHEFMKHGRTIAQKAF
ncbi:Histidine kinase [Sulfidibacter corallicola]|uniref:histidine kinase n=1 Tax=Sulfidibacter corallicola TaxID=2818388 RepID=A0A8A4TQE1_SULCO|nr:chemotaxis protein CheW [Sulfidibacter corallicola]QTD48765.1 chemotaxis protein CheW [Sulfidibacter corallicola]